MKKFSKLFTLSLVALLMIAALSACTNTYNDGLVPSPSPSASPSVINPLATPTPLPGVLPSVSPSASEPAAPTLSNQESAALATRCDQRIAQISEVQDSITVLVGNQSLSGVTFDSAYKGTLTDRIVGIVTDAVREVAPSVQSAKVTNSSEVVSRIAALHEKQKNGDSSDDIKKEFEDIKNAIK